jgi:hypothetical protein
MHESKESTQLYTNDKTHLTEQLSRDVSHRSAIEPSRDPAPSVQKIEPASASAAVKGQARYAAPYCRP